MSCKSLIYATNSVPQEVAVGESINFGQVVRRFGRNLNLSGGNISVMGEGYYDIDGLFNIVAGGAGLLSVELYKDGSLIPGAVASRTVAADAAYSLSIPPVVIREMCCCESTITAVITGVAATVNSTSIKVEKK